MDTHLWANYSSARAFLQRPAAEALLRAHRELLKRGYGLVIFDAYRPWSVTRIFWDATPPPDKYEFVANPEEGRATTAAAPSICHCTILRPDAKWRWPASMTRCPSDPITHNRRAQEVVRGGVADVQVEARIERGKIYQVGFPEAAVLRGGFGRQRCGAQFGYRPHLEAEDAGPGLRHGGAGEQ